MTLPDPPLDVEFSTFLTLPLTEYPIFSSFNSNTPSKTLHAKFCLALQQMKFTDRLVGAGLAPQRLSRVNCRMPWYEGFFHRIRRLAIKV